MPKKYELTPEHRAHLEPWTQRWIANAMSTRPMDDVDRSAMRVAIRGLYQAANLAPPPDARIVFVPSPFVARFAGGFAAAIWYLRKKRRDATGAATRDATGAATWDATRAATRDATQAATWAGDLSYWYAGVGDIGRLAHLIAPHAVQLLLHCAAEAYRMWDGGNQWSGYSAFYSFFRHIVHLKLPIYEKWQHYEAAARHGGPRVLHAEFCIISDRPCVLTVDAENRPHAENGPFCAWRDGTRLYAWHGVSMPGWMIEHPDQITVQHIQQEENAEVRRVLLQRYGFDRFLTDSGAVPIHADDTGTLYRTDFLADEPLVMVRVTNSTLEPDGSVKTYTMRVDPQCRPLLPNQTFGEPQALTAHNAVASTFGLRGEDYNPSVQT